MNQHVYISRKNRLIWHDGMIPQDEIWVKIGGDKGGGSFKMSFQICNVSHPNSVENTCLRCIPSRRFCRQPSHCFGPVQGSGEGLKRHEMEVNTTADTPFHKS